MSDYEIYTKLGISKATFYREVKRGEVEQLASDLVAYTIYSSQKAQKEYEFNATAKGSQLKIGFSLSLYARSTIAPAILSATLSRWLGFTFSIIFSFSPQ